MSSLKVACESFRKLMEEQLLRIENMNDSATDFSQKETITIGIVEGDDPVTDQEVLVLNVVFIGLEFAHLVLRVPIAAVKRTQTEHRFFNGGQHVVVYLHLLFPSFKTAL